MQLDRSKHPLVAQDKNPQGPPARTSLSAHTKIHAENRIVAMSVGTGSLDVSPIPPWHLLGQPRDLVRDLLIAMLNFGQRGEFVIRDSTDTVQQEDEEIARYKMSVKESHETVLTYLIVCYPQRCTVFGTSEYFDTLDQLVTYYEDHERSTLQIQLLHPQLKVYAYDILFPATSLATPSNGPRETMNQNKLDEHVYDVGNASHLGAASDDVPAHRYEKARPSALQGEHHVAVNSVTDVTYDLGLSPQLSDVPNGKPRENEYAAVDTPTSHLDHGGSRTTSDDIECDAATSPDTAKYSEVTDGRDGEYLVPVAPRGSASGNGGYAVPAECDVINAPSGTAGTSVAKTADTQNAGPTRQDSDLSTAAQQLSRELSALDAEAETTPLELSQTSRTLPSKGKAKRSKKKARSTKKEKKSRDTSGTPIKKSPTTRSSPNRVAGDAITPCATPASTASPSPAMLNRQSRESGLYCSAEDVYDNHGRTHATAAAPGGGAEVDHDSSSSTTYGVYGVAAGDHSAMRVHSVLYDTMVLGKEETSGVYGLGNHFDRSDADTYRNDTALPHSTGATGDIYGNEAVYGINGDVSDVTLRPTRHQGVASDQHGNIHGEDECSVDFYKVATVKDQDNGVFRLNSHASLPNSHGRLAGDAVRESRVYDEANHLEMSTHLGPTMHKHRSSEGTYETDGATTYGLKGDISERRISTEALRRSRNSYTVTHFTDGSDEVYTNEAQPVRRRHKGDSFSADAIYGINASIVRPVEALYGLGSRLSRLLQDDTTDADMGIEHQGQETFSFAGGEATLRKTTLNRKRLQSKKALKILGVTPEQVQNCA